MKDGDRCYLCGKPTDELAISVTVGGRIELLCWRCQDDLEPLVVEDRGAYVVTADRSPE